MKLNILRRNGSLPVEIRWHGRYEFVDLCALFHAISTQVIHRPSQDDTNPSGDSFNKTRERGNLEPVFHRGFSHCVDKS